MTTKPFRLLSDEEFRALSMDEKMEYLKEAMELQKALTRHITEGLSIIASSPEPKE